MQQDVEQVLAFDRIEWLDRGDHGLELWCHGCVKTLGQRSFGQGYRYYFNVSTG